MNKIFQKFFRSIHSSWILYGFWGYIFVIVQCVYTLITNVVEKVYEINNKLKIQYLIVKYPHLKRLQKLAGTKNEKSSWK